MRIAMIIGSTTIILEYVILLKLVKTVDILGGLGMKCYWTVPPKTRADESVSSWLEGHWKCNAMSLGLGGPSLIVAHRTSSQLYQKRMYTKIIDVCHENRQILIRPILHYLEA